MSGMSIDHSKTGTMYYQWQQSATQISQSTARFAILVPVYSTVSNAHLSVTVRIRSRGTVLLTFILSLVNATCTQEMNNRELRYIQTPKIFINGPTIKQD